MTSYGDIDLGQHWLVVWQCQAITWTNVDLSLKVFCGIHPRANFTKKCSLIKSITCVWRLHFKNHYHISQGWGVNSFVAPDTIWPHRHKPTLVQVMACCLTAPSHYLHQCWLNNNEVQWQSSGPLFTKKTPSYGYRDPHDKPVWRPSQVYNGNPYTDKTASS